MKTFVIGTAGHVDHGKTTLIGALTGIDTDRLREEKERGLTIDIGFAHLELPGDIELGIVDVPGHRDFLGNMLAGSTGLDALLLVVSAAEGPMPQTREHLQIAALLGIDRGVVALTHVDRVEPEFADLAADAVREELVEIVGRDDWPVVRVDSLRGDGVPEVRDALAHLASRLAAPPPDRVFRLPVDRAFSMSGTGTVVTGTAWSGAVAVGDRLRLLPGGIDARVRALQVHGGEQARVEARRRCAVGLVGVDVDDVGRGDTLVSMEGWRPCRRVGIAFEMLPGTGRTIEHGTRIRAWLGTRETMARLLLPDRLAVGPGSDGFGVLECEKDLVARAGDRLILRFYSPVELLGGARVAEVDPPHRWADRVPAWRAILGNDVPSAVAAAVGLAGGAGLDDDALALAVPHPVPDAVPADWPIRRLGRRWFEPARLDAVGGAFEEWLARAHSEAPRTAALPLESLRVSAGDGQAPELVAAVVERLVEAGTIIVEGPSVRLAEHVVRLSASESEVRDAALAELRAAGLSPPDPAELAGRLGVERALLNDLLRLLVDAGDVVQATPEILLAAEHEEALREGASAVLAEREAARPTDFREAFGVTRRYLIPLLEYLDGIGWTRRTPDGRVAGPTSVGQARAVPSSEPQST